MKRLVPRIDDILESIQQYDKNANIQLIRQAYVYSAKMHAGQLRKSGEPYLVHPIEVSKILTDMQMDVSSICTGLLHDTVEDTLITLDDLKENFGEEIASLVDGVTKLSQIKFHSDEHKQAENFRKMLVAMAKDIRVIIIKLADRIHNMRTLQYMKPEKQERIARETLDIYAPIASRLGIYWMKSEFEDLAFRYIKPKEYADLKEHVATKFKERQKAINNIQDNLQKALKEASIKGSVYGRPKHLWGIYRKMQAQDIPFENVYDLLAFRIITDSIGECYEALGLVHRIWHPVPGRIKDYIAVPKPNNYQSLHTTVIDKQGERFEVQIRTKEMHEIAEKGVAAHWKYKQSNKANKKVDQKIDQSFIWLRQLLEWHNVEDPHEFMDAVKWDLFADEVFVFTPRGDIISLRRGATPVDFAFAIHSDLGYHCSGAKVNGKIVPLRYELHNGDMIEITTNQNQSPSKDWLSFVKSSRAKAKIRSHIKTAERERSQQLGKELLEKELRRYGQSLQKLTKSGTLLDTAKKNKFSSTEEMFTSLGYGKSTPSKIAKLFIEDKDVEQEATEPESVLGKLIKKVARRSTSGVKVQGIEDMLVRFGRCCNPLPGDNIVGFVTRGRGITVHTQTCQKILDMDPARKVEVSWDTTEAITRPVTLRVKTIDEPGLLANISQTFSDSGVNISSANCKVTSKNFALNTFEISIKNSDQLRQVVIALEQINGVISVERA